MKKKRGQYPQKTVINLVMKEKTQFRPGRVIPTFAALLLAVVLFSKLAVADRLAQVDAARRELDGLLARQSQLTDQVSDYAAVQDEFSRYSSGWQNEAEAALVDRLDIAGLVERELMSNARVQHYSISANTLTISLSGVTLGETSVLVERLYTYHIVSKVEVFSAATAQKTGEEAAVSLVVTLAQPVKGGAAQ